MPSSDPDWIQIRREITGRLRGQLDVDPTILDDLVQEACIRVLRAWRKNPDAEQSWLLPVIARRTGVDYLRRVYRHRRMLDVVETGDADAALPAVVEPRKGEILERLPFVIGALFERLGRERCRELANAWFDEKSWQRVAKQSDESHAAIRKRWSRCIGEIRAELERDPGLASLLNWSRSS